MRIARAAKYAVVLLLVSSSIARGDDAPPAPCEAFPPPVTHEPDLAGPVRFRTPSAVVTEGGASLRLPAGYFLVDPLWTSWELELRRLQDAETRLAAENESLRRSAEEWQPGWKLLAGAVLTGLAAGAYGAYKLAD